jgi:hypothetical protein
MKVLRAKLRSIVMFQPLDNIRRRGMRAARGTTVSLASFASLLVIKVISTLDVRKAAFYDIVRVTLDRMDFSVFDPYESVPSQIEGFVKADDASEYTN